MKDRLFLAVLVQVATLSLDANAQTAAPSAAEDKNPNLLVQVEGTCVDASALEESLVAERAQRQRPNLAVQISCAENQVVVVLENEYGRAEFVPTGAPALGDAWEREISLMIAEYEAGLLPLQQTDMAQGSSEAASAVGADDRSETPQADATAAPQTEARVIPPPLTLTEAEVEDLARWDGSRQRRQILWDVAAGPLFRHTGQARLLGATAHFDYRRLLTGVEMGFANDGVHRARDIGVVVGYLILPPRAQRIRFNLSPNLRMGYSAFDPSRAFYVGAGALVRGDFVFYRNFFGRLQVEGGYTGFSNDERLQVLQRGYFQLSLLMGFGAT